MTITGPTISASDLTTGTLADARLSANVPLKDVANTFTANQTVTGFLGIGAAPGYWLDVRRIASVSTFGNIARFGDQTDWTSLLVRSYVSSGYAHPTGSTLATADQFGVIRNAITITTNNRVGIMTTSPARGLDVATTGEIDALYASDSSWELTNDHIATMDKLEVTTSGVWDARAHKQMSGEYSASGSTTYPVYGYPLIDIVSGFFEVEAYIIHNDGTLPTYTTYVKRMYSVYWDGTNPCVMTVLHTVFQDQSSAAWPGDVELVDTANGSLQVNVLTYDSSPVLVLWNIRHKLACGNAGLVISSGGGY